jgi:hypothetical protein
MKKLYKITEEQFAELVKSRRNKRKEELMGEKMYDEGMDNDMDLSESKTKNKRKNTKNK